MKLWFNKKGKEEERINLAANVGVNKTDADDLKKTPKMYQDELVYIWVAE